MYIVLEGKAQVEVGGRFLNLEPGSFVGVDGRDLAAGSARPRWNGGLSRSPP
jgi:hypothetical protein